MDLYTGQTHIVAQTCGWEPQLGANLNWGESDHELFFNDVDIKNWIPFAWKLDPLTGNRYRMQGTVYHASSDGRWLISANLSTMSKTQLGYGVCLPEETVGRNIGASKEDGFYLTDTTTGKTRLFVSIADLLASTGPPLIMSDPEKMEIYGFHCKFNLQADRVMLSLRWFPAADEPRRDMFNIDYDSVEYAWFTMGLEGKEIYCAVGADQWRKDGDHATWFPDGRRISMNLNIDGNGMRFVEANADGSNLHKMLPETVGSGHPTVHLDTRHLLTDTYTWGKRSFGDGTVPLRWINLETGTEEDIVRINTRQLCKNKVMRVDPHPAWDRTWRYVTFNAFIGGTRRIFVADMKELLSQ